jgi:hypothetical protein
MWREVALSSKHGCDRAVQMVDNLALVYERDWRRLIRNKVDDFLAQHGEENKGDFVLLTEQLIPRRDTIQSRHKDVADDDVLLQARRGQDEFLTIAHSSDNLESPAKELNITLFPKFLDRPGIESLFKSPMLLVQISYALRIIPS